MWIAIALFLMISPVLTVLAVGPVELSWTYIDVQRLEQLVPPNTPVVAAWQQDFVKFMRYSKNPNIRYYFLLDWPAALAGPRAFVLDYHLMQAYRDNGYYSNNIRDSFSFLCSNTDFLVLDAPNADTLDATKKQPSSQIVRKPNWFDLNIRAHTQSGVESDCLFR